MRLSPMARSTCIGWGMLLAFTGPWASPAQEGTLERGLIASQALGGETKRYVVYLPPSYYTGDRRYPSFYVLHGSGGNEESYVHMDRPMNRMIRLGEIGEMIAVFVDGDNSGFSGRYEHYITRDLVDHIDAHYRTIPHRDSRGVTGKSMGGGGAMRLALTCPDIFSVVVAQAGMYYLPSVDRYLRQPLRLHGIKIVHGIRDHVIPVATARALDDRMSYLGLEHTYLEHEGGHALLMEESISFLADHLRPLHEIGRMREAASIRTSPRATAVGAPTALKLVLAFDLPDEATESLRAIALDLSPLGISAELPLRASGEGQYAALRTIEPLRSGRHRLPLTMETAFDWDRDDARYRLLMVDLDVHPAVDEYLYQDQPGARWQVSISSEDRGGAALDVAHRGRRAQAIALPSGYIRYTWEDPEGLSTFGYAALQFQIDPGPTARDDAILGVMTAEGLQLLRIGSHLGLELTPNQWQVVSIPLEDLGLVGTRLKYLELRNVVGTLYLDDLRLMAAQYRLADAAAIPERIRADGAAVALLTVLATPAGAAADPAPHVTVDLTPIGGGPVAPLSDDGAGGDRLAGDGIFTIRLSVAPDIGAGLKDLEITSTDPRGQVTRARVPLAVVPAEPVYLYRDELAPGWRETTRNAAVDPVATFHVGEGERAMAITLKSENTLQKAVASYEWETPGGFNTYGYDSLTFQILVLEPGSDPSVFFKSAFGLSRSYPLGPRLGAPGRWQEIHIPLDWLSRSDYRLERLGFELGGRQAIPTFYVDAWRFVPEGAEAPATAVEAGSEVPSLPSAVGLAHSYPNPFNSSTAIHFSLPRQETVELAIYNLSGQRLTTLARGTREAGRHRLHWDGRDDRGRELASGVYFCRLRRQAGTEVRKLALVR